MQEPSEQAAKKTPAGSKQAGAGVKRLKSGVSPDVGKATQFKPGQSGNPEGTKPGTKHLSTHIQNLLNDPEFEEWVPDAREGWKQYKGAPMAAIIKVQIVRAMAGDPKAADWLAKYGYGTKIELADPEGNAIPMALVRLIDGGTANSRDQLPQ